MSHRSLSNRNRARWELQESLTGSTPRSNPAVLRRKVRNLAELALMAPDHFFLSIDLPRCYQSPEFNPEQESERAYASSEPSCNSHHELHCPASGRPTKRRRTGRGQGGGMATFVRPNPAVDRCHGFPGHSLQRSGDPRLAERT